MLFIIFSECELVTWAGKLRIRKMLSSLLSPSHNLCASWVLNWFSIDRQRRESLVQAIDGVWWLFLDHLMRSVCLCQLTRTSNRASFLRKYCSALCKSISGNSIPALFWPENWASRDRIAVAWWQLFNQQNLFSYLVAHLIHLRSKVDPFSGFWFVIWSRIDCNERPFASWGEFACK